MSRQTHALAFGLLLGWILHTSHAFSEELAFVRMMSDRHGEAQGNTGNGWLFHRAGECYMALPSHILGDKPSEGDRHARIVMPRGSKPVEAEADSCAIFSLDLAVMRVTGIALWDCGRPLVGEPDISDLLTPSNEVSLVRTNEGGTVEGRPLKIRALPGNDSDHFVVKPESLDNDFRQSMSGSHIKIGDRLGGFLVRVSTASTGPNAGTAKVLRIDKATLLIARLFENPSKNDSVHLRDPGCFQSGLPRASTAVGARQDSQSLAQRNQVSETCGAAVMGWTIPHASPAFRPDNLVGRGGASGRWRARLTDGENSVDIQLCGSEDSRLSKLTMDTSGCDAGDNTGFDIEAFILDPTGSTVVSLGVVRRFIPGAPIQVGGGGPGWLGRALRLRFTPHPHSKLTVACLGPLSLE